MAQVGIFNNWMEGYGLNPTFNQVTILNSGRNLKQWHNFEDFIQPTSGSLAFLIGIWTIYINGAGASLINSAGTALRPGIITGSTGTTAAGRTALYSGGQVTGILFGAGQYTVETDIYITDLSTAAEEYFTAFGFGDVVVGTEPVDGAYFLYDRAGAGVNWRLKTANNSVRTDTDSGVAVAQLAWTRLKVVVNYAGTLVSYWINDVLVGTNTLNIPTGAGRQLGMQYCSIKTAGITPRLFLLDWLWSHFDLSATR